MRGFSARFEFIPVPADTQTMVVLAANTAQAFDWPTDAHVVRLTGATTGSSTPYNAFAFVLNPVSTYAVWGSSFSASTSSSGQNTLVDGPTGKWFRIPDASTGFSVAAGQPGLVGIEFWKLG